MLLEGGLAGGGGVVIQKEERVPQIEVAAGGAAKATTEPWPQVKVKDSIIGHAKTREEKGQKMVMIQKRPRENRAKKDQQIWGEIKRK